MKPRLVIVGAGLSGSILAAWLRDTYDVTVIERARAPRAVMDDVRCDGGDVNRSINRAEGPGGTTNYWHNALVELMPSDLLDAGIPPGAMSPYYDRAWALFLSAAERDEAERLRARNREQLEHGDCVVSHMVQPRRRANLWALANGVRPGAPIDLQFGPVTAIEPRGDGVSVVVAAESGTRRIEADRVVVCAGGLSTPVVLSRSLGETESFCPGYHDHPMSYVGKVRLREGSRLRTLTRTPTSIGEVRAGLVYEWQGVKTVIYLRPSASLDLASISGTARFALSDLRNNPFSPRLMWRALTNPEALYEGVLFKTGLGQRSRHYSVLIVGEQSSSDARGLTLQGTEMPHLDWHVSAVEREAYARALRRFAEQFADDIEELREVPAEARQFVTSGHHSGLSRRFVADPGALDHAFFDVTRMPHTMVCDSSLLRAGGVANVGLTLSALAMRLAELLAADAGAIHGTR